MTPTDHTPEAADTLVEYIESTCREQCDRLRRESEAAAQQLLRETRELANRGVRQAIKLERSRVANGLREAVSRVNLERQARHQAALGAAVAAARPEVDTALAALWHEPDSRQHWIEQTLTLAERRLADRHWTVHAPADLDIAVLEWPESVTVTPRTDPDLTAGLIVEAGAARLDTTPAGLLAREKRIEGRLLGLMEGSEPDR